MREKNNSESQSNIIDIPIQIHTRLAIHAEDTNVTMDNTINTIPIIHIHHHKGIFSLFCIQKNISIPHLISAHKANIHTISLPTRFTSLAHTNIIQSIKISIHITNKNDIY